MCISTRAYNSNTVNISIVNADMPYKIIIRMGEQEYSFECFRDKDSDSEEIMVTPPINCSDNLAVDEYNMSSKTIGDFIAACKMICMDYLLN